MESFTALALIILVTALVVLFVLTTRNARINYRRHYRIWNKGFCSSCETPWEAHHDSRIRARVYCCWGCVPARHCHIPHRFFRTESKP